MQKQNINMTHGTIMYHIFPTAIRTCQIKCLYESYKCQLMYAENPIIYDNIHEKLFWRFFKDCDKNIDLILEIHIFLIHQLVCFWEKFVKMPISGPVEA